MAGSSQCLFHSQFPLKVNQSGKRTPIHFAHGQKPRSISSLGGTSRETLRHGMGRLGASISNDQSFLGGSRIVLSPKLTQVAHTDGLSRVKASWITSSEIANNAFTLGTVFVLPFYTLMVAAPNSELTKKSMESSIPYVMLGLLYAYLLYLSWSPDTLQMMFASKYWLPELPGIAKMFSKEMTLASAWIHLLAVDLFAARQVYLDGVENNIETRHSVSLCLLFCPVGIVDWSWKLTPIHVVHGQKQRSICSLRGTSREPSRHGVGRLGASTSNAWSFLSGSRIVLRANVTKVARTDRLSQVKALWITSSEIANNGFTFATVFVFPFYILMVAAPNSKLTKKSMESSMPYVVLGFLYTYLLYLSWSPDSLQMLFSSKYLMPELPGITKMFSREMTLASAWIHLVGVDLFAARQVYLDGQENNVETRHSVSLCLLACPVGILSHIITKLLIRSVKKTGQNM